MRDLTIIYGIGATKAGTSWLHDALAAHTQVHARAIKELHYWSSEGEDRRAVIERQMTKADGTRLDDLRDLADVMDEPRDVARYVEYLAKGRGAQSVLIDSTPVYGTLPAETLTRMAAAAPVTRFVYLMRDPVARAWSHIRMMAKRSGRELGQAADALLAKFSRGAAKGIESRGDYVGTLKRLDVLPQNSVLVMFYEDLMSQTGFDRVLAFLGLAPMKAPLDVRVLQGASLRLQDDQRSMLQQKLAPQYAGVNARMGRLPDAWHDNWMRT
ncbi:sulfotransferase [Nereida sp. MMG025]|uniref:sulfotransferase n=1 Tax=Nereida sp. MMG025 TaxID=2909981 RepID=UPI001F2B16EB|nr:sulfotransferase [Nereida sp. MMG025]MCF6445292.1 sulfotransferase [Nereida sp. MMG025]